MHFSLSRVFRFASWSVGTALLVALTVALPLPLAAAPSEPAEKPRMAAMDLLAREGISAGQAQYVSDLVRTAMVKTDVFVVVDRQSIQKVLDEQALQKSGACSDTSCTVRVGQLLAANKMLTGSVIQIGKRVSLNVNIIDVEKATIEFAESESADDLERIESATQKLANRIAVRITGRTSDSGPGLFSGLWDGADGKALWRSAVLPGWGQYHRGETYKAAGILGGTVLSLLLIRNAQGSYNSAQTDYDNTANLALLFPSERESIGLTLFNISQTQAIADRQNEAASRGTLFVGLLGAVYVYNLIDAAFFGGSPANPGKTALLGGNGRFSFAFALGGPRSFSGGVVFVF